MEKEQTEATQETERVDNRIQLVWGEKIMRNWHKAIAMGMNIISWKQNIKKIKLRIWYQQSKIWGKGEEKV